MFPATGSTLSTIATLAPVNGTLAATFATAFTENDPLPGENGTVLAVYGTVSAGNGPLSGDFAPIAHGKDLAYRHFAPTFRDNDPDSRNIGLNSGHSLNVYGQSPTVCRHSRWKNKRKNSLQRNNDAKLVLRYAIASRGSIYLYI